MYSYKRQNVLNWLPCCSCGKGNVSTQGQAQCTPCKTASPNASRANDAKTACEKCQAGRHLDTSSDSCVACGTGKVSIQSGQSRCTSCDAGNKANTLGTSCDACEAGKYSSDRGSVSCTRCTIPLMP